ncbi:MAG: guanylate kinase [Candidatus Omnitrophota bacterium]
MSNKASRLQLVWIVSGPSGSGKTTLCEALLKEDFWSKRLQRSISYTTRPARPGEQDGKDYHFISEKKFLALKKKNAFLEQEKIFDFYYGTPKKAVIDAKRLGKDVLLCIDVKGAREVKKTLKKNTVSVFVVAPALNALVERLQKRSTENKKDIEKRVSRVKMELSYASDYDYIIVNDNFREALNKIKAVLTAKRCEGEHVLYSIGKIDR